MNSLTKPIYTIGLGASAEGGQAVEKFILALPASFSDMLIVVQNLPTHQQTDLADKLTEISKFPVAIAEDGTKLKIGHVYVCPVGKFAKIEGASLRLFSADLGQYKHPIDEFFTSLAEEKKRSAVGILMASHSEDGAKGLQAVKHHGGLTIGAAIAENVAVETDLLMTQNDANSDDGALDVDQIMSFLETHRGQEVVDRSISYSENLELLHLLKIIIDEISIEGGVTIEELLGCLKERKKSLSYRVNSNYRKYVMSHPDEVGFIGRLIKERACAKLNRINSYNFSTLIDHWFRNFEGHQMKVWILGITDSWVIFQFAIAMYRANQRRRIPLNYKIFISDHDTDKLFKVNLNKLYSQDVLGLNVSDFKDYFDFGRHRLILKKEVASTLFFNTNQLGIDAPLSNLDAVVCNFKLSKMPAVQYQFAVKSLEFALKKGAYFYMSVEDKSFLAQPLGGFKTLHKVFKRLELYRVAGVNHNPTGEPVDKDKLLDRYIETLNIDAHEKLNQWFQEEFPKVINVGISYFSSSVELIKFNNSFQEYFPNFKFFPGKKINHFFPPNLLEILFLQLEALSEEEDQKFISHAMINHQATDIYLKAFFNDGKLLSFIICIMPTTLSKNSVAAMDLNKHGDYMHQVLRDELFETQLSADIIRKEAQKASTELHEVNEKLLLSNEEFQTANEELQSLNAELMTVNSEFHDQNLELRQLNADMLSLMRNSNIGTVFLDGELEIKRYSPLMEQFFGIQKSDLGRCYEDLAALHKALGLRSFLYGIISSREVYEDEIQLENKKWYLRKVCPSINEYSVAEGVVVTFIDIDELKKEQSKVQAKEKKLSSLISATSTCFTTVDLHGRITFCNKNIWNNNQRHLMGLNFIEVVEDLQIVDLPFLFKKVNLTGQNFTFDHHFDHRLYGVKHYTNVISPVIVGGHILEYSIISTDITEIIEAKTQLESSNADLERFAYIASHDLQEPLRTIINFAKLIEKNEDIADNAELKQYLSFIDQASARMSDQVQGLLEHSRIGRKRAYAEVDLVEMIQEAESDLSLKIAETQAEITYPESSVVIWGSGIEVKLLFQNLLNNAIKFRKKDVYPRIQIDVKNYASYVEVFVKDNGIGIAEKYHEKIFMIFQRLHNRADYEGTGIGLAYCKKIVESHGGKISVVSDGETGSTFIFTLPKYINNA